MAYLLCVRLRCRSADCLVPESDWWSLRLALRFQSSLCFFVTAWWRPGTCMAVYVQRPWSRGQKNILCMTPSMSCSRRADLLNTCIRWLGGNISSTSRRSTSPLIQRHEAGRNGVPAPMQTGDARHNHSSPTILCHHARMVRTFLGPVKAILAFVSFVFWSCCFVFFFSFFLSCLLRVFSCVFDFAALSFSYDFFAHLEA